MSDRPVSRASRIYLAFLTATLAGYAVLLGTVFMLSVEARGYLDDPIAHIDRFVTGIVLCGMPFWILRPRSFRDPSRWYHVLSLVIFTHIAIFIGAWALAFRALQSGVDQAAISAIANSDLSLLLGLFSIGTLIMAVIAVIRSGRSPASEAVDVIPSDGVIPGAPPLPAPQKTKLEKTHLFFIRLTGLAMFGSTVYAVSTMVSGLTAQVIYSVLGLFAAVLFLSPRRTPRVLARPTRWYHFFGWNILATILGLMALGPILGDQIAKGIALGIEAAERGQPADPAELAALNAGLYTGASLWIQVAIFVPLQLAWFTMIGLLFQPPSSQGPRAAKPARIRNPKLPAIGAAMKLYLIADWVVLRVLGLALIGSAYMLWQLIERDRVFLIDAMAQGGLEPMTALYIYAGFGIFLTMPFLLPRFLSSPHHVVGGLMKALLLVFTALVLYVPLQVAIVTYTPEIYHATLQATVPRVFKAVAGIAVTSALLISFFKQLGSVPKMDYQGRPVRVYSAKELHEMRHARMGTEAPSH